MKKALVLFSKGSVAHGQADAHELIRVLDEAAKRQNLDISFDCAFYEDLLHVVRTADARIIDTVSGKDIASFDVVYQRRWQEVPEHALACAIYLKVKGVHCIDQESYTNGSKSKLTQAWRLWEVGLSHPATVYAGHGAMAKKLVADCDSWSLGWPMVMKGVSATRGQSNYVVHSVKEIVERLNGQPKVSFLFQAFVPNDGDYRVIVCGGQVGFVMKRVASEGTHLNNTSQGGSAVQIEPAELPADILSDSLRAAASMDRDVAGVDVVIDKQTNQHYFFEVNRAPQIESGKYIQQKADVLAKYLYTES